MTVEFDRKTIEDKFQEAEDILLDRRNISIIHYEDFDHEEFDNTIRTF